MILRALPLRHGRLALPRTTACLRPHRRRLASDTSLTSSSSSTPTTALPPIPRQSRLKPEDIRDPTHPVVQAYLFQQHARAQTDQLGAELEPHYRPHDQLSNPPRPQDITLEALLAAQAHLGHATSLWHPGNARYIHGIRGEVDGPEGAIHIISLDVTAAHLRRACAVVRGVAARGGLILFVGTRPGQARSVVRAAQLAGGCHLFTHWTPGAISNAQQILGRCKKRVVDELDNEVLGFQDQLRIQAALKPDLVVCLNPLENFVLLRECGAANVPTIGIIDTDANPTSVTYPIPANDDSLRCVQYIAGVLGRAGQEGSKERLEYAAKTGRCVSRLSIDMQEPRPEQVEGELEQVELELRAKQRLDEAVMIGRMEPLAMRADGGMEMDTATATATATATDENNVDGAGDGDSGVEELDPSLLRDDQQ